MNVQQLSYKWVIQPNLTMTGETAQSTDRSTADKNDGGDKDSYVWNKTYTNYHEFQSRDD